MSGIHQFLAGFSRYDAISNEAILFQQLFKSWGYESEIFSEPAKISTTATGEIKNIYKAKEFVTKNDLGILHLSIGSAVNDVFPTLPSAKAMLYHNITPAYYLRGFQEELARKLEWGRRQVKMLKDVPEVTLADSLFNAKELESEGYTDIRVLPLVIELSAIRNKGQKKILRMLKDGLTNILFVGRYAPNKRLEDILHAFYFFQKYCRPDSRLIFVGSRVGMERYEMLLKSLVLKLELKNVQFVGTVSQEELNAYYQGAHIFLCMSEHEGFCIPLLESMVNDLPVCAFATAAVPETLGGAGVIFHKKRFDMIAEMMLRMVTDIPLRKKIIEGQRRRLLKYQKRNLAAELKKALLRFLPE